MKNLLGYSGYLGWKYEPNNDISVLLNMSIPIIYVSSVPEL